MTVSPRDHMKTNKHMENVDLVASNCIKCNGVLKLLRVWFKVKFFEWIWRQYPMS